MKATIDSRTAEILLWDREIGQGTPKRLTPTEAIAIGQRLAALGGQALAASARNVRVGDVLDLASALFKSRR